MGKTMAGRETAEHGAAAAILEVEHVTFTYEGAAEPAMRDVSLAVAPGEFIGVIGTAGSGKSTLVYALDGVIPHVRGGDFYGAVRVAGIDTHEATLTDISRTVATMFQDVDAQMTSAIVEDEVLFGLENFGVPHSEIFARVNEALSALGIADLRDREIATLSGGQKQKVALASVLALKPRALVLDEPTGALDPASSRAVFDLLARLNRDLGVAVVVVEQKIGLLAEYADRIAVMDGGRIVRIGGVPEVLAHEDELLAVGVNVPRVTTLSMRLAERGLSDGRTARTVGEAVDLVTEAVCGGTSAAAALTATDAVGAAAESRALRDGSAGCRRGDGCGSAQGEAKARSDAAARPFALECRGVFYAYGGAGGREAVRDLDLGIRAGEFVAIVGSNGAGKTTTSKLLAGLVAPTAGEVLIDGVSTAQLKARALAQRVGVLFQDPDRQICQNTVRDELAFGPRVQGVPEEEAARRVDSLVREFGFDADAAPYLLSRGERQLLALASVLASEPGVLILDEPTCGLDYRECMCVMERVAKLNLGGATVVMITHDMEVALDFASRIVVMADGRVIADGAPGAVFRDADALAAASLVPPQMVAVATEAAQRVGHAREFAAASSVEDVVRVASQAAQAAQAARDGRRVPRERKAI